MHTKQLINKTRAYTQKPQQNRKLQVKRGRNYIYLKVKKELGPRVRAGVYNGVQPVVSMHTWENEILNRSEAAKAVC